MPGMQRGFLTSPRRPPAPAAAAASASPALSPSAPAPASSSAPAPAPAPAPAGNDNSVMDVVKATLGTQQPTALGAIEHLKTSLKATLRADPSAKTANLSQNDARNLYAVAVWLEEAVLREQHNPATSTLEARLSALTKVLDRNTTELTKVRTTLASRPVAPVELDDELLVEQELGVAPPVAAASTWAAVAARRKPGPPKVPLEQRMDPAECLLKRSGTADPAFTGLNPAQKVVKLRESIRASQPSDTSDSAIQAADPAKLVRAVRPLPSGDLVVVSSSADHSTLLKQHAAQWLPRATSSLGLHNPRWGVVIHRVPTSFSPSSPTSVAALRADNEHLIPADAEISWLSPPPPDGSKKHGSIVAQLPSLAQANKVIEAGIAFDGRLLRVEKVMRSPPQCWRCQRYGHVSLQCKRAPRCGTCAKSHLTKDCACTEEQPCSSATTCPHISIKCANCALAHKASDSSCPTRKEAFDAAKLRALRFGETYTIPPSTSS